MIPRDEFWRVMEAYGAGIRSAQIVFYIAGILFIGWLLLKPSRFQTLLAKLYLSIAFVWNGIVFYFVFARDMADGSYGNYVFGCVFIIVSVLFAVDLFRQKMQFSIPTVGWQKYATLALTLLVFCYPLFGVAFGHSFTSLIMPGTFPCPTTALGLLLLTIALPQVDKVIYILLLICAIPFTPFVQIARYGVYEDTILFATGIYGFAVDEEGVNGSGTQANPRMEPTAPAARVASAAFAFVVGLAAGYVLHGSARRLSSDRWSASSITRENPLGAGVILVSNLIKRI